MPGVLFSLIVVLLAWLLLYVLLTGLGAAILCALAGRPTEPHGLSVLFWVGWAGTLAFLQLWHLFAPVNGLALLTFLALGVAACVRYRSSLARMGAAFADRTGSQRAILFALAVWLAHRAMGPVMPYDAGLYHLHAVRWASSHAIVPGLGNLHGRLAFNSSHFLFLALLDQGPGSARGYHLGGGLLLLVTLGTFVFSACNLLRPAGKAASHDMLGTLLLPPVVFLCFIYASSSSPDPVVFVTGAMIGVSLCRLVVDGASGREATHHVLAVVLLSAASISLKLSAVVFGACASLVACGWLGATARNKSRDMPWWKVLLAAAMAALLVLGPLAVRSAILSGYPFYPSDFAGLSVDWRIPRESVVHMQALIRAWALQPGVPPEHVLGDWDWLEPWFRRMLTRRFEVLLPLAIAAGGVTLWLSRRSSMKSGATPVLLLAPPAASLAFWLFTAPDPRLAGVSFWLIGTGCLVIGVRHWNPEQRARTCLGFSLVLLLLTSAVCSTAEKLFIKPGPDRGFHPVPTLELRTFVTESGLEVCVPVQGDQCWESALLCTPYPNPKLRLRRPGDLGEGFTVLAQEEQ